MLQIETDHRNVTTLRLDRPEVHNAFNAELIEALAEQFGEMAERPPRVLVLTGQGRSFSAGADLGWMRSMTDADEDSNRRDAERLAAMFRALDELPCPTIARVNGPAFGGGVGLICCCDIAIGVDSASFGLTEVRLGLIPATIAPFVLARIGTARARRWMLTGERFGSRAAVEGGLLHEACPADALDAQIEIALSDLLASGPTAVDQCKQLIRRIQDFDGGPAELDAVTAAWIAQLRVNEEGQEGLRAFLEKRKPGWLDGTEPNR